MATQNRIPTLGFGASIAAVVLLGFGAGETTTTAPVRQADGVAWAATPTAATSWPAVGTSPAWPSTPPAVTSWPAVGTSPAWPSTPAPEEGY